MSMKVLDWQVVETHSCFGSALRCKKPVPKYHYSDKKDNHESDSYDIEESSCLIQRRTETACDLRLLRLHTPLHHRESRLSILRYHMNLITWWFLVFQGWYNSTYLLGRLELYFEPFFLQLHFSLLRVAQFQILHSSKGKHGNCQKNWIAKIPFHSYLSTYMLAPNVCCVLRLFFIIAFFSTKEKIRKSLYSRVLHTRPQWHHWWESADQ